MRTEPRRAALLLTDIPGRAAASRRLNPAPFVEQPVKPVRMNQCLAPVRL
jgi:hypothetical protein